MEAGQSGGANRSRSTAVRHPRALSEEAACGRRGQRRRSQPLAGDQRCATGGAQAEPLALRGARGTGAGRPESREMRRRNAQPERGGAGGHASADTRRDRGRMSGRGAAAEGHDERPGRAGRGRAGLVEGGTAGVGAHGRGQRRCGKRGRRPGVAAVAAEMAAWCTGAARQAGLQRGSNPRRKSPWKSPLSTVHQRRKRNLFPVPAIFIRLELENVCVCGRDGGEYSIN
jgi:hypothetical protein